LVKEKFIEFSREINPYIYIFFLRNLKVRKKKRNGLIIGPDLLFNN